MYPTRFMAGEAKRADEGNDAELPPAVAKLEALGRRSIPCCQSRLVCLASTGVRWDVGASVFRGDVGSSLASSLALSSFSG
jgi:hypothetical protein